MLWYEKSGKDGDVVLSTRVRLARNLVDYPFDGKLDEPSAKEIISRVKEAFEGEDGFTFTDFGDLSANEAISMSEKHLVSREFAAKKTPHALVSNENIGAYVMIGEEDHIRIQTILAGYDIAAAYKRAADIDEIIDGKLNIAYSESLGYLTHCPTNLGTAMRASVMMHLPAMTVNREMASLRGQLEKIGLTVRGMSGEGSEADGCIYQISNQITLGKSEDEIVGDLKSVIDSIIKRERELRCSIDGDALTAAADKVSRAYGIMKYARLLSGAEYVKLYSDVRLGVAMGIIKELDTDTLDRLLIETMPATLVLSGGGDLASNARARDGARADLVREALG